MICLFLVRHLLIDSYTTEGTLVMSDADHTRQNLEHLWKIRVDNVKTQLDTATNHLKKIGNYYASSKTPPAEPDTRENAIRVYTEALTEYVSVSKVYQDLVLHGRVPDREEPLQSRTMSRGQGGCD